MSKTVKQFIYSVRVSLDFTIYLWSEWFKICGNKHARKVCRLAV